MKKCLYSSFTRKLKVTLKFTTQISVIKRKLLYFIRARFNGLHTTPRYYRICVSSIIGERHLKGDHARGKIFFSDNIVMHVPRDHHFVPFIDHRTFSRLISAFKTRKSARRRVGPIGRNIGLRLIGIDLPSASRVLDAEFVDEEKVENNVGFMRLPGYPYFIRQID